MLASAIILLAVLQTPKSMEELELAKIKAWDELRLYREVLVMSLNGAKLTKTYVKSGHRFYARIDLPDGSHLETLNNGEMGWTLLHRRKTYYEGKVESPLPDDPKSRVLKAEEGAVQFKFDDREPVRFATNPMPEITSTEVVEEGGKKLRRVIARATGKSGGTITFTQWFLPDRWIIKKFKIEGGGEDGPFTFTGEATEIDFKPKIDEAIFTLDPKQIEGYTKAEGS